MRVAILMVFAERVRSPLSRGINFDQGPLLAGSDAPEKIGCPSQVDLGFSMWREGHLTVVPVAQPAMPSNPVHGAGTLRAAISSPILGPYNKKIEFQDFEAFSTSTK